MPYLADRRKQTAIALGGFGAEVGFIPIFVGLAPGFGLIYIGVAATHLIAYRFYAGDVSDFRWL